MNLLKMTVLLSCATLFAATRGDSNNMMDGSSQSQTDVTITYLQNDGVLISDGTDKVLIDAVFNFASGWINLNATEAAKVTNAQAPYDDVDLILITHNHGDHYSTSAVNNHMGHNANTRLIAPPQVAANFSGSQILTSAIARGQSETLTVNGIEVEVLHLRHFDAFGNDFSGVQNFGYLVKIGGMNILHLGDVDMTIENFQNFGLADKGIDVVLIPTFNTEAHFMTSHRDALNSQIQPANIIALHLLSGSITTIQQQVNNLYPGATIFTTPLQSVTINVTSVVDQGQTPERFSLEQNYPNPFNPTTTINYTLPKAFNVELHVYNLLGQKVKTLLSNQIQSAGQHIVQWDGKDESDSAVASGTYVYRLIAHELESGAIRFSQNRKMVLKK